MILSMINTICLLIILGAAIYMFLNYVQVKADLQKLAKIYVPNTSEGIKLIELDVKLVKTVSPFDMNAKPPAPTTTLPSPTPQK
jgi:hypothetical protein